MDTCFKYNCTLILGLEPIRRIRSVGYVLSLLFELIYTSGVMARAALGGGVMGVLQHPDVQFWGSAIGGIGNFMTV